MMVGQFAAPTRLVAGLGASAELGRVLADSAATRVALVGDEGLARLGMLDGFRAAIEAVEGLEVVHEDHAKVDPTIQAVERAATEARASKANCVVGVGGGSALSQAKAVALLLHNPDPIAQYAGVDQAMRRPAFFVAIPTTAGSGSEVSNAFVLYDSDADRNIGMRGWGYEPDVALLDGHLLERLPADPFRDASIDALSHGFEALWAKGATNFSDLSALHAVQRIIDVLPAALSQRNPDQLQLLMEASTMANFGCGNAGLGLVHALSGSSQVRVPHGRQNGVFLPLVAEFNREVVSPAVREQIDRLPELYEAIAVPTMMTSQELPEHPIDAIVQAASHSPFRHNNLRPSTVEQLREIAERAVEAVRTTT